MSKAAHPVLERLCLEGFCLEGVCSSGLCSEREECAGACLGFSELCASWEWFALALALALATSSGRMRCSEALELVWSA